MTKMEYYYINIIRCVNCNKCNKFKKEKSGISKMKTFPGQRRMLCYIEKSGL